MIITTHARHRRAALAEAALWALWTAARWTGAGTLAETVRARSGRFVTAIRAFATAVRAATHRATVRAELAAAEFLVGPAADAIGAATARFQRRAPFILASIFVFASLIPAVLR